jgi:fructose-1,6-bisphosphatase/inositol monophosphatase family enzyme
MAERGSGSWCGGERLQIRTDRREPGELRGAVLARFLTGDEDERMTRRYATFEAVSGGYHCAGYEYPAIIAGHQEFALFQRLMPWDHAPGALLLTEAGGVANHPDGRPFRPDPHRRGLLLAANDDVWHTVRAILYGDPVP